jgi:hypothetical protein
MWGGAARCTQMEIYGACHCSNDYCVWGTVRTITDFDTANHWMIDRGDGTPSVNLVILSFVNPLKLLNLVSGELLRGPILPALRE